MFNPMYKVETFNKGEKTGTTYANIHVSIVTADGVDNTEWFTIVMQMENCNKT